jgi:hypothetical protein
MTRRFHNNVALPLCLIDAEVDKQEVLHMAGIVRVHDGVIVEGRVIRDRIGLAKRVNC